MIKIKPLPPLEFLNECFELDSSLEGGLRWKERPRSHFTSNSAHTKTNNIFKNKPAGTKESNGYWSVCLNYGGKRRAYKIQRIIYSLFHNELVNTEILVDHIDRNTLNNNPNNLRLVNHTQNAANRSIYKNNKYGATGICFDRKNKRWSVSIQINKKKIIIGRFNSIEKAIETREKVNKIKDNNFYSDLTHKDFIHLQGEEPIRSEYHNKVVRKRVKNKSGSCDNCNNPAHKGSKLCNSCFSIKWPSVEEMTSLIWEKTAKDIGLFYNVGENSVTRFCRRNKIPQPSRKYREDQKKLLNLN